MGHMALSWAMIQVLAAVPSVPEGETKKPPVSPPLRSFSFLLFQLLSPFGVQTELKQQLHTPDAQSIGQGTFCCGGNKPGSRYREIVHHNGFRLLPAFSEPCSPPSCVSSHTSLMPPPLPFFPFECSKRGLGIFTLRLLLSTSSD